MKMKKILMVTAALLCATAAHAGADAVAHESIAMEWRLDENVYYPCMDHIKNNPRFRINSNDSYETEFYKCQILSSKVIVVVIGQELIVHIVVF
jgi:hypothetical protein